MRETPAEVDAGFVTASTGNHGAAVGFALAEAGANVAIVLCGANLSLATLRSVLS